jgi:hypothetical protein
MQQVRGKRRALRFLDHRALYVGLDRAHYLAIYAPLLPGKIAA